MREQVLENLQDLVVDEHLDEASFVGGYVGQAPDCLVLELLKIEANCVREKMGQRVRIHCLLIRRLIWPTQKFA